ncbi:hypothetical protein C0991_007140, partial [Blastosporella zonata]
YFPSSLPVMRAYYYDNIPGDQRLPHDYIPSQPVSEEKLTALGVKFWSIPVEGHESSIDIIAAQEGYKNRDTINVSKEGLGEVNVLRVVSNDSADSGTFEQLYETKIKGFFEEYDFKRHDDLDES